MQQITMRVSGKAETGEQPWLAGNTYTASERYAEWLVLNDMASYVGGRPVGWRDLTSPPQAAGVPAQNAPTLTNFGPTATRREYAFGIDDRIYCQAFHVNHDVKPGGRAFVHVHWSTNGSSTATVQWEFAISRALGHGVAAFGNPVTVSVTQAAYGAAWRHMIGEVETSDALTLQLPDELILVTLKRVTNGGTDNLDTVFALAVDFHYEADRDSTPNKAPDFYT